MMGRRQRVDQSQLVYLFNLEKEIPADLLRRDALPRANLQAPSLEVAKSGISEGMGRSLFPVSTRHVRCKIALQPRAEIHRRSCYVAKVPRRTFPVVRCHYCAWTGIIDVDLDYGCVVQRER